MSTASHVILSDGTSASVAKADIGRCFPLQSPNIKKASALKDYLLLITFVNDEKKIFDLKPYLKYPVF